MLSLRFQSFLKSSTGSTQVELVETLQSLWSGYGSIDRYRLLGGEVTSVIVKHVRLPRPESHARGWNTNIGHERKVKSYQVETCWYENYSHLGEELARMPKCYGVDRDGDEVLIVLEDLDEAGYDDRLTEVSWEQVEVCLEWLANFHASYLQVKPKNLWEIGSYWHLATRPEELQELTDMNLKNAAAKIDAALNGCEYLTLVHGDAKLANFCFGSNKVAAVDFQYVGGGCGMKDVAYFIGSCMSESQCEALESQILDTYFNYLKLGMTRAGKEECFESVKHEWKGMYHIAWADFHRFLKGWSPGHWKINSYSEKVTRRVVDMI